MFWDSQNNFEMYSTKTTPNITFLEMPVTSDSNHGCKKSPKAVKYTD